MLQSGTSISSTDLINSSTRIRPKSRLNPSICEALAENVRFGLSGHDPPKPTLPWDTLRATRLDSMPSIASISYGSLLDTGTMDPDVFDNGHQEAAFFDPRFSTGGLETNKDNARKMRRRGKRMAGRRPPDDEFTLSLALDERLKAQGKPPRPMRHRIRPDGKSFFPDGMTEEDDDYLFAVEFGAEERDASLGSQSESESESDDDPDGQAERARAVRAMFAGKVMTPNTSRNVTISHKSADPRQSHRQIYAMPNVYTASAAFEDRSTTEAEGLQAVWSTLAPYSGRRATQPPTDPPVLSATEDDLRQVPRDSRGNPIDWDTIRSLRDPRKWESVSQETWSAAENLMVRDAMPGIMNMIDPPDLTSSSNNSTVPHIYRDTGERRRIHEVGSTTGGLKGREQSVADHYSRAWSDATDRPPHVEQMMSERFYRELWVKGKRMPKDRFIITPSGNSLGPKTMTPMGSGSTKFSEAGSQGTASTAFSDDCTQAGTGKVKAEVLVRQPMTTMSHKATIINDGRESIRTLSSVGKSTQDPSMNGILRSMSLGPSFTKDNYDNEVKVAMAKPELDAVSGWTKRSYDPHDDEEPLPSAEQRRLAICGSKMSPLASRRIRMSKGDKMTDLSMPSVYAPNPTLARLSEYSIRTRNTVLNELMGELQPHNGMMERGRPVSRRAPFAASTTPRSRGLGTK